MKKSELKAKSAHYLSGQPGHDAQPYQDRQVRRQIEASKNEEK